MMSVDAEFSTILVKKRGDTKKMELTVVKMSSYQNTGPINKSLNKH